MHLKAGMGTPQDRWRERAKRFPEFNFKVHFGLHFWIARISDDAS